MKFIKKMLSGVDRENNNDEESREELALIGMKDTDVEGDDEIPLHKRLGRIPKIMVKGKHEFISHVVTLRMICGALFLGLGLSIYTISQMPSQIVVKYAPQLRDGATLKLGEFPKAAIITDVQFLWLALNTWEKSGRDEANQLLWRYSNFMTPQFKSELEAEYKVLGSKGALDRKRMPHAVPGQMFEFEDRVVQLTDDSWVVYLDIVLEESTMGELIRQPTYRFAIQVERFITNLELNPIGIRLAGFREPAKRIKD